MKHKNTYFTVVQWISRVFHVPRFKQDSAVFQPSNPTLIKAHYIHSTSQTGAMPNPKCKTLLIEPPPEVRGMKILDREAFRKYFRIPFIKIPHELVAVAIKTLKPYFLKVPCRSAIQNVDEGRAKFIYLNPDKVKCFNSFSEAHRVLLGSIGITEQSLQWKDDCLTYDNWKADVIFKAVFPPHLSIISSFSIIGHIIHLNLRPEYADYKHLIGQVLLDKVPNVRTVINKVDTIDSAYRNFQMEILAGEQNTVAQVKENGLLYHFDFARVYWNPRLSTEHARIIGKLRPGDLLYDVFAGVGPFAIPAARNKCRVLANDLNPCSFEWLQANANINKVTQNLAAYNLDGRTFISGVVKPDLIQQSTCNAGPCFQSRQAHIVMNLPALAIQFLDAFRGIFADITNDELCARIMLPYIHVYCFVPKDSEDHYAIKLVEDILGCSLDSDHLDEITLVRDVAPQKLMCRVSFKLPKVVAFRENVNDVNEPSAKKPRLSLNDGMQ